MTGVYTPYQLQSLVNAYETIERYGLSQEEVQRLHAEHSHLRRYLHAERQWKASLKHWLDAERKHLATQAVFDSAAYAAAKRGWEAMRAYVPNLDGAGCFEQLADSLSFRYAAFAAAVLGLETPPEIESGKQVARRHAESRPPARIPYVDEGYDDSF